MGEVTIRFAESAVADLEEIRLWYVEQDVPDVGERLITEIFQRIEAPGKHPELGRIVPEFDQPFLRELIQPPFRIVYRHDPGKVRIVRVWRSEHGSVREGVLPWALVYVGCRDVTMRELTPFFPCEN